MKISAHYQQKTGGDPTLQWILARCGVITASDFDSLVTPLGKVKTGEGVETYLSKKLAERWIGGGLASFNSFSMEQGVILEERAIPFAELEYGLKIQQIGFITNDSGSVGCSPDGLIGFDAAKFSKEAPTPYKSTGDESGIEIKCPTIETHIKYLLAGELPKDYIAQVQGCMFVTGCKTWHFLSYCRKMPALHLVIERDEKYQDALKTAIDSFLEEFNTALAKLVRINGGEPKQNERGIVPFKIEKSEENPDNPP